MIRLLTENDLDPFYDVVHEGYQADKAYPISFAAITATKEDARQWLLENPCYGWFEEGRLASTISLHMPWSPHPGPKGVPHLGWVTTHPDFKHHGFVTRLYRWIEAEVFVKELRVPSVTLGTAQCHPWLCKMYESWGFVPFKVVQLPGKKHRTVFMEKDLAAASARLLEGDCRSWQ